MNFKNGFKNLFKNLPIGLCATMVGVCTLSNVFALFNLVYLKHIVSYIGVLIIICFIIKFCLFRKKVLNELKNPTVGCIYPTFAMLLMVLSSYFLNYNIKLGQTIWFIAIIANIIIIVLFTYFHIISKFEFQSMFPGWFVGFIGIIVSVVNSNGMENEFLVKIIYYFGFSMYIILLPIIIFRLIKHPIEDDIYPSLAILPAPASLCIISTIILYPNNHIAFITTVILYLIIQISLFLVYIKINRVFKISFSPVFASLTFPLAISCLAGFKYSAFLMGKGYENISNIIRNIAGIELFIASGVILIVGFRFARFIKNLFLDGALENNQKISF